MWRQALTIDSDGPAGRRWMDGEKTEEEQSSQSRVKSECYVKAGRPGFKPRTVPPPQGPGGRCRGTYGQCPSGSDA